LLAQAVSNPDRVDVAQAVMKQLGVLGYQLSQDDCTLVVVEQYDPAACSLTRSVALSHQAVEGLATEVYQALLENAWSEEVARSVQLLVMEHGVNVVDHAGAQPDSRLTLQLRLSARQAFLRFRDLGREWNYQAKLAASQQNAPDSHRGRGLNIIRAIAKHIDRVRLNRENITHYVVSRFFEVSPGNEERSAPHE
jgi:anti-sigma regulatory factor (Ser/Thr protein kinase)